MERAWASGHLSKFRTHRRNCLELKSATSKVTTNTNLICSLLYFKNWYNFSLSKNIFSGSNYPFQILGLHNAHFLARRCSNISYFIWTMWKTVLYSIIHLLSFLIVLNLMPQRWWARNYSFIFVAGVAKAEWKGWTIMLTPYWSHKMYYNLYISLFFVPTPRKIAVIGYFYH